MGTAKIITKRSIGVLSEAERQLRELVGSAAAAGDYEATLLITGWARVVGSLVQEAQQATQSDSQVAMSVRDGQEAESARTADSGRSQDDSVNSHRLNSPAMRRVKRSPSKDQYPKFFRRGDQLVKIGWSKKERQEYEHKAPHRVVDTLAAAIAGRFGNGKLFAVEDLLPLKDPNGGSEIPSYQAYVALAWLRLAGLLKRHGRRGYSVESASGLADALVTSWQRLPEAAV